MANKKVKKPIDVAKRVVKKALEQGRENTRTNRTLERIRSPRTNKGKKRR